MLLNAPESLIQETSYYPQTCVAFDVRYAEIAKKYDVTYDVDHELIRAAMKMSGMSDAVIADCPVIISMTDQLGESGAMEYRWYEHDESTMSNVYKPTILAYSYEGTAAVSAYVIAHEAVHAVLSLGNSQVDVITAKQYDERKKWAIAAGVIVGAIAVHMFEPSDSRAALVAGLILGDNVICAGLIVEYMTRLDERLARRSETFINDDNIVLVTSNADAHAGETSDNYANIRKDFDVPLGLKKMIALCL